MTNIDEIKRERVKALYDLDMAMTKYCPEADEMARDIEENKTEFLIIWKKYKNEKSNERKFLDVSVDFAKKLQAQEEMFQKFRKIITPLQLKYEATCEEFHKLEEGKNE